MPAPLWPRQTGLEEAGLLYVLKRGRWGGSGAVANGRDMVQVAENLIQRAWGVEHAILVCNGTAALRLAYRLMPPVGGQIEIPALCWVACETAARAAGFTVFHTDVDDDLQVSTPGYLAVHYGHGYAKRALAATIEDASQAHGYRFGGSRAGSFGTLGVLSFQSSKTLTCGEGGVILTNDPVAAYELRRLRADGRDPADVEKGIEHDFYGREIKVHGGENAHLSEFNAAVLVAQLSHDDSYQQFLSERAEEFHEALETEGFGSPAARKDSNIYIPAPYRFAVTVPGNAHGYATFVSAYLGHQVGIPDILADLPNAKRLRDTTVFVPHQLLTLGPGPEVVAEAFAAARKGVAMAD